jgi:hypothetical protein
MDDRRFDAFSRSLAHGLSRRQAVSRLGAGGLAAGFAAVFGRGVPHAAGQATGEPTCRLALVANVRLGPSAGALLRGTTPGELRGDLEFGVGEAGAVDGARLRLADDTELPVVGQVLGRALHLRVALEEDQPLVLVGTAAQDLGDCAGAVGGPLTGPQPGDLGDWHATATAIATAGRADPTATTGAAATTAPTGAATTAADEATVTPTPPCSADTTPCGGACVDLMSDPDNCGACGDVCRTDENCVRGECGEPNCERPGATTNLTACGRDCVDLQTAQAHCGACDNPCLVGFGCTDGECVILCAPCESGQTDCGNCVCADLQTDKTNCGGCGINCFDDQVCNNGACQPVDPCPGQTDCGGACVNLQSDPNNCGGCGVVCESGQCDGGSCIPQCGPGERLCPDGQCIGGNQQCP